MAKDFDNIIIANPSLEFKDDYKELEGAVKGEILKIRDNFHDKLTLLIDQHKECNRLHYEHPGTYDPVHTLIILDDCIDSKLAQYRSSENIADEIAERGRHYNMSVIISAQYLTGISPSLRRNAEYLFIFSPTNYSETEKILEEYVPKSERKRFQELMKGVFVEKHSFILLDNSPESRIYYKLRFRRGFLEYMFPMKADELEHKTINKKRKTKEDFMEQINDQ
jgi:hypothetical protein